MNRNQRTFGTVLMAGLIALSTPASAAAAGWMGFRNDTSEPIVLLETVVVNGQLRPGRPQRLAPGEAIRDTQCVSGQRQFSVYDPKRPSHPIYSGLLPCPGPNENLLYLIKSDRGSITVEPARAPALSAKK